MCSNIWLHTFSVLALIWAGWKCSLVVYISSWLNTISLEGFFLTGVGNFFFFSWLKSCQDIIKCFLQMSINYFSVDTKMSCLYLILFMFSCCCCRYCVVPLNTPLLSYIGLFIYPLFRTMYLEIFIPGNKSQACCSEMPGQIKPTLFWLWPSSDWQQAVVRLWFGLGMRELGKKPQKPLRRCQPAQIDSPCRLKPNLDDIRSPTLI